MTIVSATNASELARNEALAQQLGLDDKLQLALQDPQWMEDIIHRIWGKNSTQSATRIKKFSASRG